MEGGARCPPTPVDLECLIRTVAAAPAAARSCSISGNGVELYTGGSSTVKLQHKDGKLQGTFTITSGKQFFLTLTRQ